MRNKTVKLLYFSLDSSEVKEISLDWKRLFLLCAAVFCVLLLLVGGILGLFTNFYRDVKMASLGRVNALLKKQLAEMAKKVAAISSNIENLEKRDDALRIVAELPRIDDDTRDVGIGGTVGEDWATRYEQNPDEYTAAQLAVHLDQLARRLSLIKESYREIGAQLQKDAQKGKHTPSIRPVDMEKGIITDKFGFRLHPLIERYKHHDGIDISAERGTEVYATADGLVETAQTTFLRGHGYGKEVVINHGNGVKTRYGHLSKVFVREGQKVTRWDKIGLVGDTGLATGPHLHYEVIVDGRVRDPMYYILN